VSGDCVLVNYWYAYPVGHAIEGLRYALGYKAAEPTRRVSLLLSGATPVELADCCPFLDEVYAVPYTGFEEPDADPHEALAAIPREWDWVVDNHRAWDESHDRFRGFRAFFDAAEEHFAPRRGRAPSGAEPPSYLPHQELRLELPQSARAAAHELLQGRRATSVVLAGHSGGPSSYPSARSWALILSELSRRFPDVVFCLIGRHAATGSTSAIAPDDVSRTASSAGAMDCFDRPLLEQLAIVEASALFLSPHTGFGFAALAVGTPWLTISGAQWPETFFNSVPFYSVLPETERYPAFVHGGSLPLVEEDGPRTASMSAARIRDDLPELVRGAELLLKGHWSFDDALADYFPRLLKAYGGDRSKLFSFDGIHEAYV
jgi:hypothetical protein